MKKVTFVILLLVSTSVWAEPNPEYSINIHVVSSYSLTVPGMGGSAGVVQKLSVLIDGKKYELSALLSRGGLLALGDYKARLVRDEHKSAYESRQQYELIFPDKTTKKFWVSGQSE